MAKRIPLTQNKFAIVDDEDFDQVNQYKWYFNNGYARRWYLDKKTKKEGYMTMHRLINNTPKGMDTDHINHNGLDNRKENLRSATRNQNNQNYLPQKHSSKYKGVYWNKKEKKFKAYIGLNGKAIHLGYFKTEIEGAKAYDRKAKEIYGEFAYLNF